MQQFDSTNEDAQSSEGLNPKPFLFVLPLVFFAI